MAKASKPTTGRLTGMRSLFSTALIWLADWQIIPVGLLSPLLIFPDRFSPILVSVALLAIPVLWVLHRLARGRFFTATPLDIPLLVLLAALPVGLWASAIPDVTVPHIIKYLLAIAVIYALVNTFNSADKVTWAGWAVLAGVALVAAASLLGTAWGGGKLPFLPAVLAERVPRLINAFWNPKGFHPNIVGGILAMWAPVTAAYLITGRSWSGRLLFFLLLTAEGLTLMLTQSRGGMLGFAAALLVVAVGRDRRWLWGLLILLLVAAAGVGFYGVQPSIDLVMSGAGDSAVSSAEGRLELFSRGLYMLQDFPFTGIGPGMFPEVLPVLYPLFLVGPDTVVPHVHNIYLQMGIDHGFPGLIAFLALIILLVVMGVQAIRSSRGRPWEPLAIGLLGGLAAYLVHGLVDATGFTPRAHIMVWTHFGLMAALWSWIKSAGDGKDG